MKCVEKIWKTTHKSIYLGLNAHCDFCLVLILKWYSKGIEWTTCVARQVFWSSSVEKKSWHILQGLPVDSNHLLMINMEPFKLNFEMNPSLTTSVSLLLNENLQNHDMRHFLVPLPKKFLLTLKTLEKGHLIKEWCTFALTNNMARPEEKH